MDSEDRRGIMEKPMNDSCWRDLLLMIFASVALTTSPAEACGPFCTNGLIHEYASQDQDHPLFNPGLNADELVQIYRVLSGKDPISVPPTEDTSSGDPAEHPDAAVEGWKAALTALAIDDPSQYSLEARDSNTENQGYIHNCTVGAFRAATETLKARARTYGASDLRLRRWIDAQRLVFAACDGSRSELPEEPAAGWEKLEVQDRAYQRAAAEMYALHHQQAIAAFRAIAGDQTSPWRFLARYLVSRVRVRELSLKADGGSEQDRTETREEIEGGLRGNEYGVFTGAAGELLSRLAENSYEFETAFLTPESRRALGERVGSLPAAELTVRDLRTYLKTTKFRWEGLTVIRPNQVVSGGGDLDLWLQIVRCDPSLNGCVDLAKKNFEAQPTLPWAIALADQLSRSKDALTDPVLPRLRSTLEKASAQGRSSAATTLALGQLQVASGDRAAANASLAKLRAAGVTGPLVNDLAFLLAGSVEEQAKALDQLAGKSDANPTFNVDDSFPARSLRLLNSLPAERLADIADHCSNKSLAALLRTTSFTRAALDKNEQLIARLLPKFDEDVLERLNSNGADLSIDEERKLRIDLVRTAAHSLQSAAERRIAALFLLSLSDALPYLSLTDGLPPCSPLWWCSADRHEETSSGESNDVTRSARAIEVPAELLQRYTKQSAPVWFGEAILSAVDATPESPFAPALLSRYIWAMRSACPDPAREPLTKRAFRLLKSKYRDSPFAGLTPYRF